MAGMKRKEVTPGTAARLLRVHIQTVQRWCREAIGGGESMLRTLGVTKTPTGRYLISRDEIDRILGLTPEFA